MAFCIDNNEVNLEISTYISHKYYIYMYIISIGLRFGGQPLTLAGS
jgi:hypothetical protein